MCSSDLLLGCAVFFLGVFALRDSDVLLLLACVGLGLTAMLSYIRAAGESLVSVPTTRALNVLGPMAKATFASAFLLLGKEAPWRQDATRSCASSVIAVSRGALYALPLVVVFGALLSSADARFEALTVELLAFDPSSLIRFFSSALLCGAGAAALLRIGVLERACPLRDAPAPTHTVGVIELTVVMSMLNVVFATYLLVQATYFFGGDTLVRSVGGPTYSAYARRGFFELIVVAMLTVPVLLTVDWLAALERNVGGRIIRGLIVAMVVMVGLISASAVDRMVQRGIILEFTNDSIRDRLARQRAKL